ncbi:MAG: 30S ribosomal protein S12 methylthiotransferase RimO [Phycisphaerae bacterium]|jgi:ribosomal protein S12 methylthiotransferase|nr:30S ribosomal protein S12 methylthiotransferase RimO [Phycisphaerae bacterium]
MTDVYDKPVSVALVSLGCPKNLVDSEKMLASLAQGGCVVGAPMDDADVIVINTCGFVADARDEAMGVISEALAQKASGRATRVVVAGCLAQRNGDDLFAQAPGIDAIVGVNDRQAILQAVTGQSKSQVSSCGGEIGSDAGRFRLTPRHVAYLRVAEGCSHHCTFCTIPSIRGAFRSKPAGDVLSEAAELIADGAVELNVIAQDTTSYGSDQGDVDLAGLLRKLDAMDGTTWIRLMYTYPRSFSDELVSAIIECGHVVPYVDMPLQHISDSVLKRMGRKVSRQRIEELLDKLRDANIAVRTTFIVGFPGETQTEFDELLEFATEFEFDAMGVFAYSPEPGTPAAKMPDQVPDEIKAQRLEAMMAAQQEIAFAINEDTVGQLVDVLVDGVDEQGRCVGRHAGQAPEIDSLCVLTDPLPAGEMVTVEVVGSEGYDLIVTPLAAEE